MTQVLFQTLSQLSGASSIHIVENDNTLNLCVTYLDHTDARVIRSEFELREALMLIQRFKRLKLAETFLFTREVSTC
ncbi:hypothetical protein SE17_02495 [Kouleothrix aurantiaca]|uniref:Uncharacterized protein n=1 Tax=Kouleothrix aurantiaca TaxID=186479 RepID=A0A0P9DAK0_9CHLR|nr:hypothetical protein SE17_02495 [Kouleothrix aurantiaca]